MYIRVLALIIVVILITWAGQAYAAGVVTDASGAVLLEDVSPDDITELVDMLGKDNVAANQAGKFLVEYGEESVPDLLGGLESGKATEKTIEVLGEIKDPRALEPVMSYINDKRWPVANMARNVVSKYGDMAVPGLMELLKDDGYREAAVRTLEMIKPSGEALDTLRGMLDNADDSGRAGAAELAGIWNDVGSSDKLVSLMKDGSALVRLGAVKGYGEMGRKKELEYDQDLLVGMLSDPDAGVRLSAAELMRDMDNKAYVPKFIELIKAENNQSVLAQLVMGVQETGDQSLIRPMLAILSKPDSSPLVLSNAVYALGFLHAKEAVPHIVDLIMGPKGESVMVQKESLNALATIGEPLDMDAFIPFLKTGDPNATATTELLTMMDKLARPGDDKLAQALENYRKGESDLHRQELADRILKKIQ